MVTLFYTDVMMKAQQVVHISGCGLDTGALCIVHVQALSQLSPRTYKSVLHY